jgi:hypothetical protein
MNAVVVQHTLRMRIYWSAWLAIVALALLLRFTVRLGASSDRLFRIAQAIYEHSKNDGIQEYLGFWQVNLKK